VAAVKPIFAIVMRQPVWLQRVWLQRIEVGLVIPLGHCQAFSEQFVYFAKTSEPDLAAIDFPAFFRVDLSGSMAAPSI
jgi:hypothetical protein